MLVFYREGPGGATKARLTRFPPREATSTNTLAARMRKAYPKEAHKWPDLPEPPPKKLRKPTK